MDPEPVLLSGVCWPPLRLGRSARAAAAVDAAAAAAEAAAVGEEGGEVVPRAAARATMAAPRS